MCVCGCTHVYKYAYMYTYVFVGVYAHLLVINTYKYYTFYLPYEALLCFALGACSTLAYLDRARLLVSCEGTF